MIYWCTLIKLLQTWGVPTKFVQKTRIFVLWSIVYIPKISTMLQFGALMLVNKLRTSCNYAVSTFHYTVQLLLHLLWRWLTSVVSNKIMPTFKQSMAMVILWNYEQKGFTTCLMIGFSDCGDHLQLQIFLHFKSVIIQVAWIALDMSYCI
jgi:hypothetical protein